MTFEVGDRVWFFWIGPTEPGTIQIVDHTRISPYFVVWDVGLPDENGWFQADQLRQVNN